MVWRRVLIATAVIVTVVALVLGAAYLFQRKLIYLPYTDPLPPAGEALPGGRDVTLQTEDGLRLGAWFFPAADPSAPAVLFAPGNAGDRSLRVPLAAALTARGISVLLVDYRGFGGNPGDPTEDGLRNDVRAARNFLVTEQKVPPGRLLYYGESLGCGPVTALATEHPPAGMLLRSPFTELAAVGERQYPFLPVRWLLKDRFPVEQNVRGVGVPVTVVYGERDSVVPAEQSRAVAAAANARTVEVPGVDHNDPSLLDGPQLVDAVIALAGPPR